MIKIFNMGVGVLYHHFFMGLGPHGTQLAQPSAGQLFH
jgi:hypothetical protein